MEESKHEERGPAAAASREQEVLDEVKMMGLGMGKDL